MKGNAIFIGVLVFILLIGAAGWAYKEGYFLNPATETEQSQQDKAKNQADPSEKKSVISEKIDINKITKDLIDQRVTIQGEITSRFDHKDGHVFLTLDDQTGSIKVVIFSDKNIAADSLIEGEAIKVSGAVDEYEGELEIVPERNTDISLADLESGGTGITEEQVGQQAEVVATIVSKYPHPEGHLFLNVRLENNQEISIPLFESLNPNSEDYPVNSVINVQGMVKKYKGDLQIVPDGTADVQVLEKGNDLAIEQDEIKSLSEQDRGKMVIVEGFVQDIESRDDGHLMFYLEQNGKRIKTILFRADSKEIQGRKDRILHAEKAQFAVRVAAMVDVYEDELELIVDKVLVD